MTDHAISASNHHPKVLVVEDEAISRRALTALLIASGFPTPAVASAEEALEAMGAASPPAIALVDLDLPGMSGLELIHRLHDLAPDLRSVLITATSRERLDELLTTSDVDYMRKPINFNSLLQVLASQPDTH